MSLSDCPVWYITLVQHLSPLLHDFFDAIHHAVEFQGGQYFPTILLSEIELKVTEQQTSKLLCPLHLDLHKVDIKMVIFYFCVYLEIIHG
jgi:hypothetical protein